MELKLLSDLFVVFFGIILHHAKLLHSYFFNHISDYGQSRTLDVEQTTDCNEQI